MEGEENNNNINLEDDELSSYQDEYIELNSTRLKINKYYLPFLQSKEIPISKIRDIKLVELNLFNGKYKLIGLDLNLVYYHLDNKRSSKSYAITLKEEDNLFTIGITPENPMKCFKVLKNLMNHKNNNNDLQSKKNKNELLKDVKQKMN